MVDDAGSEKMPRRLIRQPIRYIVAQRRGLLAAYRRTQLELIAVACTAEISVERCTMPSFAAAYHEMPRPLTRS